VPAKPRSITTWHVTSRISALRSSTVCFFTGSNAIAGVPAPVGHVRRAVL